MLFLFSPVLKNCVEVKILSLQKFAFLRDLSVMAWNRTSKFSNYANCYFQDENVDTETEFGKEFGMEIIRKPKSKLSAYASNFFRSFQNSESNKSASSTLILFRIHFVPICIILLYTS